IWDSWDIGVRIGRKTARRSVQQLGRQDVRDAKGRTGQKWKKMPSFVWYIRDKSTRRTRITRFGASQSISGGSENFVPGSPGKLGQKYAEDANRL
ncbi:hypothetical protein KI387_013234, partial [Taxus chinensis]